MVAGGGADEEQSSVAPSTPSSSSRVSQPSLFEALQSISLVIIGGSGAYSIMTVVKAMIGSKLSSSSRSTMNPSSKPEESTSTESMS